MYGLTEPSIEVKQSCETMKPAEMYDLAVKRLSEDRKADGLYLLRRIISSASSEDERFVLLARLTQYSQGGNAGAIQEELESLLPVAKTVLGSTTPEVINGSILLAKCYLSSHKYFKKASPGKAQKLLRQALRDLESAKGPHSPESVEVLDLLAQSLKSKTTIDKYNATMDMLIESVTKNFGPHSERLAQAYRDWACHDDSHKLYEEAHTRLVRALEIYENIKMPEYDQLSSTTLRYELLLYSLNRADEIEPFKLKWQPALDEAYSRMPPLPPGPSEKPFSWEEVKAEMAKRRTPD